MKQDILEAKILIVDDQDAHAQVLSRVLSEAGYSNVSITLDSTQVCALHRRNAYDLILLDIEMPGLDGFGVMEGLKLDEQDSYLPVIVLTAHPGHKLRALQAGAKDFISKPFDFLEVKTRIYNMLEVRLLYRKLEGHNRALELAVQERTAELRESEARYRSLTELASDWFWEQDMDGTFTHVSGPVTQILGVRAPAQDGVNSDVSEWDGGWDESELASLQTLIAARQPVLDYVIHRTLPNGPQQQFRVSGQPMFDATCRFIYYRGTGVEFAHSH